MQNECSQSSQIYLSPENMSKYSNKIKRQQIFLLHFRNVETTDLVKSMIQGNQPFLWVTTLSRPFTIFQQKIISDLQILATETVTLTIPSEISCR